MHAQRLAAHLLFSVYLVDADKLRHGQYYTSGISMQTIELLLTDSRIPAHGLTHFLIETRSKTWPPRS